VAGVHLAALALVASLAAAAPAQDEVDPEITDGSAQRMLDAAEARWRTAGIRSYDFRVQLLCFCRPDVRAPRVLRVRRGRPLDPPRHLREVATVPRMHRLVQEAIDERVAGLTVRYGRRGLPRRIDLDPDRGLADDEHSYTAGRLRAR
jgi:hypothetical protein